MTYNFRRAFGISLALYFSTFIVGLIVAIITQQDGAQTDTLSDGFWWVGMNTALVLSALYSLWYFNKKKVAPSWKSGLYFGLTAILVSFALDLLFFAFGSTEGAIDLGDYYGDIRFWITVAIVIVTSAVVGVLRGMRKATTENASRK